MVKIPKFFHEVLGEEQSVKELFLIGAFVLMIGAFVFYKGWSEWQYLSALAKWVVAFIYLDVSGGVIANFTSGTNAFYAQNKKARIVFIAIHVQPLLLSLAMGKAWILGLAISVATIVMAFALNHLRESELHKIYAGFAVGAGLVLVSFLSENLTFIENSIYLLYTFKVLYSFSVDHFERRAVDDYQV